MNTWDLLQKELTYFGILIKNDRECIIVNEEGEKKGQGIIKTMRQIDNNIKKQKKILLSLWNEVIEFLQDSSNEIIFCDEKMINLFIFCLKDMTKFLLCFDKLDNSKYGKFIMSCLDRDINSFTQIQIMDLSNYKISIDWVHRKICKLLYIKKLLSFASTGKNKVVNTKVKMARGVSGPWSNLDLPTLERVFPFGTDLQIREKDKKKQRRYRKGLSDYGSDQFSEGHTWREIRNEPYSWYS